MPAPPLTMRFASAVSDRLTTADAVAQLLDRAKAAGLDRVDVALLFMSADHREEAEWVLDRVHATLSPDALIGCTGEGVIGGDVEIERSPGMSLLIGQFGGGVRASAAHVGQDEWANLLDDPLDLSEHLGCGEETRLLIGLGDPWTTPVDGLLRRLDELKLPMVGGMASAGRRAGENRLFIHDKVVDEGFVGLTLSGALSAETIVSQGCRPIGGAFVVTKAKQNVIEQLGGKPALEQLRATIEALPEAEKELLRHGLFIGRAISEYRDSFGRGDFLIRNVMGIFQEQQSVAAADVVRVGQTVQFHVRDAATADEDLREMLAAAAVNGRQPDAQSPAPAAALLFTCNGRGTRMFESPGHDVTATRAALGPGVPIAGFFAGGEIGPVAGTNFMHGHTASLALIRPQNG